MVCNNFEFQVNPTRTGMIKVTTPDVITKLKSHVLENFTSLKKAFLVLDEVRHPKRKPIIFDRFIFFEVTLTFA